MADAVKTILVEETLDRYIVHLSNISDGTGESAVIKVDKSTLLAKDGAEPASLDIESCRWNVQGFASVRILWDHTTDDVAMAMSGSGYEEYANPKVLSVGSALDDPRSAGGAGDILLTTNGGASGSTYDIELVLKKRPD